jgi:hypothetical protein
MIVSILYISNQKSLIKNQQSFYHLILNLMTLPLTPEGGIKKKKYFKNKTLKENTM